MLTILNVGYPFAPVGPDAVGGAEQILTAIDRTLAAAGHRSIVVAPRGSETAGELVAIDQAPAPFTPDVLDAGRAACRAAVDAVLAREPVDAVHFHGVDCAEYLPRGSSVPQVVTLHLWPDRYPRALLDGSHPGVHLVCVSEAQRAACDARVPCRTIPNGVDLAAFRPGGERRRQVLLLGRVSPEKGFHLAMDAAVRAGLSVVLAGAVFPYESHRTYFDYVIAPRLSERVRFVGPVGRAEKQRLLATSCCVAIPSIVPETSSLTAMEALASGTPVVALRTPALDALVEHGRTGFLVETEAGMAEAFAQVDRLCRERCREAAEEQCSLERMTQAYLRLYDELSAPTSRPPRSTDAEPGAAGGMRVARWSMHEREPEPGPHDRASG